MYFILNIIDLICLGLVVGKNIFIILGFNILIKKVEIILKMIVNKIFSWKVLIIFFLFLVLKYCEINILIFVVNLI